jgi:MinD superfamily P-loop ATPase
MKALFLSLKGGVGKSCLATFMAANYDLTYVTNDLVSPQRKEGIIQIESNKKRIPKAILALDDVVFDFGANSTYQDPKISQLVKHVDLIVVPTLTDPRSLEATIKTVKLLNDVEIPIIIIINKFRQMPKYETARDRLINALGRIPIYYIKETTLFDRMTTDGQEWYRNIDHVMGEYQLKKTNRFINNVFERIIKRIGTRK